MVSTSYYGLVWPLQLLFMLHLLATLSIAGANEFIAPTNSTCACQNEILTYTCTAVGGGATLWTGSGFSSCTNNEIILRHNVGDGTAMGQCNGGAIVGRNIRNEGNRYTSELRVNISNGLNNTNIRCLSNSDDGLVAIGEAVIVIRSGSYEEISDVTLISADVQHLTFSWSSVESSCPTVRYNLIASSGCGTCSITNNKTMATCSGLHLPSVCNFGVRSEICGFLGAQSNIVMLAIKEPSQTQVDIIPVYSSDTRLLLRLTITYHQVINIPSLVLGASTTYTTSNSKSVPHNSSCMVSTCEIVIDISPGDCSSSEDISVTVSLSNNFGQGPPSTPQKIGCTNQFVVVEYNSTLSAITCQFLNQSDSSVKSCIVTYGSCDEKTTKTVQQNSSAETPNYIVLEIDRLNSLCYNVTASNDTFIITVERKNMVTGRISNSTLIAIIVVFIAMMVVTIIMVLSVIVVIIKRRKLGAIDYTDLHEPINRHSMKESDVDGNGTLSDERRQHSISKDRFIKCDIECACQLKEYVEKELKKPFWRGCAFYEFHYPDECISAEKEIVLMDMKTGDFYSLDIEARKDLVGDKVSKPSYDLKVFVQSTGSGVRYLERRTVLLYENENKSVCVKPDTPLKPVITQHLKKSTIPREMTYRQYCTEKQLPKQYGLFLELDTFDKGKNKLLDVILMDKGTEELFTGPNARRMVTDYYQDRNQLDLEKWKVFVLCKQFKDSLELKANADALEYQVPRINDGEFHVIKVDEDRVRMSDFVKRKLGLVEFNDADAFYEFTGEENLLYLRDVIYAYKELKEDSSNALEYKTFYDTQGAPDREVKPPQLKQGIRAFIQSSNQGSRCLKEGQTVLYKKSESLLWKAVGVVGGAVGTALSYVYPGQEASAKTE